MTVLSAARAAARRQDEQLVTLVAQALDPWPVRVFVDENRPGCPRGEFVSLNSGRTSRTGREG